MRRPVRAARFLAAMLTAVVLPHADAGAQAISLPEIKAAFLFNFARFVEWPADAIASGAALELCVDNDGMVADALERTIKGRNVEGHVLALRRLTAGAPMPTCHLLYLGGADLKRSLDTIETVKSAGVFTVSDAARFAQTGGIAELFIEDGRVRIAVNVDALQRAGIRLNSRVLVLAKIVYDTPQ